MTTFLYTLNCPETGRIRYVGKSDNPFLRWRQHIDEAKAGKVHSHKIHWIQACLAKGFEPCMELLDEVPVAEWQFWEKEYIRVFRMIGMQLVNELPGGDGGATWTGKKHSNETKRKMSAWQKGVPKSAEFKQKLSMVKKRISPSQLNTPETCAKISAKLKGRRAPWNREALNKMQTPEARAKMARSLTGRKLSAETRAKMSASHQARWAAKKLAQASVSNDTAQVLNSKGVGLFPTHLA